MAAFCHVMAFHRMSTYGIYISLAILTAGIICTARLIDSNHTTKEIYWGLFIGVVSLTYRDKVS